MEGMGKFRRCRLKLFEAIIELRLCSNLLEYYI